MYAIVELGGKQFTVEKGSRVRCEKIEKEANETFQIERVLMVRNGDQVQIGKPYLQNVQITARVVGRGRAKKIIGLKYRPKKNYRIHYGHRQHFTALVIEDIRA